MPFVTIIICYTRIMTRLAERSLGIPGTRCFWWNLIDKRCCWWAKWKITENCGADEQDKKDNITILRTRPLTPSPPPIPLILTTMICFCEKCKNTCKAREVWSQPCEHGIALNLGKCFSDFTRVLGSRISDEKAIYLRKSSKEHLSLICFTRDLGFGISDEKAIYLHKHWKEHF